MQKRVFKRKKKINVYRKRKGAGRAITLAATVCLFLTAAVLALAVPETVAEAGDSSDKQQAPRKVVTDINHRHVGNSSVQGGCYNSEIEHKHIGNEMTGGACFLLPVPHEHKGNENEQGGCYVTPVPHDHVGDEVNGGPCYAPSETHYCTDECFTEESCIVSFKAEEVIGSEPGTCFEHGSMTFTIARGTEVHSACPEKVTTGERTFCPSCGPMSPSIHDYQHKICGMENGQVLRYVIDCLKTVDRYKLGCGKEPGDADSYNKTCEKKVDGYEIGCGFKENEVCGRLIVTNETPGQEEKVTLSARVEDLSGGKLKLSSNPFTWKDENGNLIGEGKQIQVSENGDYFVTVKLENDDVDKAGLSSKIIVDNIYKAEVISSPKPTATPSGTPKATSTPKPSDTPKPASTPKPSDTPKPASTPKPSGTPKPASTPKPSGTPQATDTPEPTTTPAPSGTPHPTASATPSDTPKPGSKDEGSHGSGDSGADGNEGEADDSDGRKEKEHQKKSEKTDVTNDIGEGSNQSADRSGRKLANPSPENTPSPSPGLTRPIQKETKEVTVPEKKSAGESQYKTGQQTKDNGLFASPAVRIISITTGLALLLLGLSLLLMYLRNSVKVYNDNGKGRMIYLGRCMVEEEEDAYSVTITEKMIEKAYTNRYCIKPGLFLFGKKEGEELIVHKESKRVAVCLDREMIVML